MYLAGTDMSCGVQQMTDITHESPKENLLSLGDQMYNQGLICAFVQWSDVWGRNKGGNKLYHYIRRHFPKSSIQRTKTAKNPNSRNRICVYIWKVPRNFKSWWKKQTYTKGCSKNKYDTDWCTKHDCYPESCPGEY